MTTIAATIKPRSWGNRLGSAAAATIGTAFLLATIGYVVFFGRLFQRFYGRLDIKGGLPPLTQNVLDLGQFFFDHLSLIVAGGIGAAAALAFIAASARSRWAFQAAGWFAAACLILWSLIPAILLISLALPIANAQFTVGQHR